MPWTGNELYVAAVSHSSEDRLLDEPVHIAGHSRKESVSQPRWGPDGSLFFASDRSGYWKLYRVLPGASEASELVFDGWEESNRAEFSSPEWMLGLYIRPAVLPLRATYH